MAEFQAGEVVVPVVPDASGFIKTLQRELVPKSASVGREVGQQIHAGIQSRLKDLSVQVSADTARARSEIQALARGSGQQVRIQVDADTAAAQAQMAAIDSAVSRVNGRRAEVRADADTAAAQTGIAGVQTAVSALDGRKADIRVDVDVAGALAQLGLVSAALAALPAVAAAGLGAAGLAGAAVAAGVGVGALAAVAVPSIGRISDSLKEQERAQKAASSATSAAAGAAQQAQIQALNLAAAEQRVVDAKKAALAAEQELTRARQEAKRAAEDLALAAAGAALSEEDALLGVEEARQRLAELQADPKADELALKRAELAVRQAEQRAKEASVRNKRAQQDQAAADKAGIEGSAQVIAAKKKIEDANRRLEDSERALRVMQLQQAAAAKQQAAATRGVATEITKLTPAAAALAKQWKSFSDVYENWQKKLEPAVLPALGKGLDLISALLPKLTPLVRGVSEALGGLLDGATKALGGKFWTDFFKDLSAAAPTAVTGLGKAFGNIVTGVAGVIKAFLPFVPTIVGGIQQATAAFASWGKGLGQSSGFQSFIQFAQANAPKLIELFRNIGAAIGNIVSALAPFGAAALAGLAGLAGWISKLSPSAIQAIAIAIGSVVLGVKAWTVAQRVLNVVLSKNPIGLIITAVGLLVAGLTYAYQNSETFRNIVDAALRAIGVAAQWLWTNVLQPVFNALVALWQNVIAPAATWLWQSVLQPAFQGIGEAIQWAWENLIQPAMNALVAFWQNVLGPVFTWLWNNIVQPAFEGIGAVIKWAWENLIKPAVAALVIYWQQILGPVITWLWNNIVKPAFDGIGKLIKAAWDNVIKPAVTALVNYWRGTLGPAISWLWENVVKPAWEAIGSGIKTAWEKVIKPAVQALWTFITDTLPSGFKKGVEMIGKFWEGLKKVAAAPVEFVVNTVYNNGIAAVWNAVADALKLPKLPLLQFKGFATGGIYPGYTPGRDIGVAAVSGGEAIMRPEWTRAVGSDFVHGANAAARRGGVAGAAEFMRTRFMGAFAGGGIVGDILAQGVKFGAEKILNPILDRAASAMGDSPFAQMLINIPKTLVAKVIEFLTEKEAEMGGPGAQKALEFARAQLGKPYKYGAAGPNEFDCSGLTMRAWQAGGRSDIPRTSQQQMAWVKKIDKPVPGALGFPNPGHVWIYTGPNSIIEAPQTGKTVQAVAARAAQVIGIPPAKYDSGGYLPTGHSLVYNGTGRPEPVLTDQQWQAIQSGTRGGDGPLVQIDEFRATPTQSPQAIAQELYWLSKSRPR